MKIDLYDHVLLKNGKTADIVEILGNGKAFIADVDIGDDYDTITVLPEDIEKVIS